jgi:hypothetical protein
VNTVRIDREALANDVVALLTWWHVITWKQIEARRAARAAVEQVAAEYRTEARAEGGA